MLQHISNTYCTYGVDTENYGELTTIVFLRYRNAVS